VKVIPSAKTAGFTLVEVLIGLTLSLMVMGAVLSGYVFLGRNFSRTLGISSANEPTLESQGRRTLSSFMQDVRMASGLITTLPTIPDTFENLLKLKIPSTSNSSGTSTILYYYNPASSSVYLHTSDVIDGTPDATTVELFSHSLTRVVLDTSRTTQVLHRSLLSCTFSYYDSSGNPYTVFDPSSSSFSSLSGIKQIAITFSSQGGNVANGTQTPVYSSASPRVILRNTQQVR